LRAGESAAHCWADTTGAEHAARVVAMLRRRMAAVARAYAPSRSVH
jgi:hypothetical protein